MSDQRRSGTAKFQWTAKEAERPERAMVLVPDVAGQANPRTRESRLLEAEGLARAISLDIVESGIVPIKKIHPGTLLGSGKVEQIKGIVRTGEIGLAIIDHALSPVQQQNLEKAWNCKVLDRTALILEIFGARARTREGKLQVELARLTYQKGRLVRSWTHLERQRGGLGFVGGPGETQIEADRRMIQERIDHLSRDLEKVRKTRTLHRSGRKKVPYPMVALVGYTNAGKSTLFNRLTGAGVMAEDQLFATLDTTSREIELPGGPQKAILSDTVGFVSNLPTHLVASFRATLEEVVEADLILHVRDIADPDTQAQADDVYAILADLGIAEDGHSKVVEVWNKIDQLDGEAVADMRKLRAADQNAPVLISAISGEGIGELEAAINKALTGQTELVTLQIAPQNLHELSWVYDHSNVVKRTDKEDGSVSLKVRATPEVRSRLLQKELI